MNSKLQPGRLAGGLLAAAVFSAAMTSACLSKPAALALSRQAIDQQVARAMRTFQVPGMAVAIVKDGRQVFAKGYGVREAGKPARVDADTVFQIGSNTKAFTTAALAILVDEGKLHWNDKVIDHLPDFRMYDPYVTREFTIIDLLTHRSGLGLGAGDLMFYPTTDFSREDIIRGLRHLKPVSSFRSQFDYDNLLYMVAGQLIPAITGKSWEDFIDERVLGRLKMQACAANYSRLRDRGNLASPHMLLEGKLEPVAVSDIDIVVAAGTINCSVNGMSRWLLTQLAGGKAPDGATLFSADQGREMWSMRTVLPVSPEDATMYRSRFAGYALGWGLSDALGYQRVAHTGGVPGMVTWVSMIPDLKLGVLVFTNQQNGAAMSAVGNQILDAYLGAPKRDWIALYDTKIQERDEGAKRAEAAAAKVLASAGPPTLPLEKYTGTFHDPWRGDATVRLEGGTLHLQISHTASLEGPLLPYRGDIFIVRWKDRTLNADAFVRFEPGFDGTVTGMTLRAVSPATDFSFDFQDLNFRRANPPAPP